MKESSYEAKTRYSGDTVTEYENKRKSKKWDAEQLVYKKIISKLDKNTKILDVPIGTGRFLTYYRDSGHKITGVDISEDMLDYAEKNCPENFEIRLVKGDAEKLDFDDKSFDYVISARFLNWLPPEVFLNVLTEFSRVSKRGIIIQVRLIERCSISDFIKHVDISYKTVKKKIIKKLFVKGKTYNDYYLHEYKSTMDFLSKEFRMKQIDAIDTRITFPKFQKETFYTIWWTKK